VSVSVRAGFAYLDIKVQIAGQTTAGDMIFQLYSDLAPNSAAAIGTLVNSGFYTNLTFHRVARDPQTNAPFVIQGGDPKGDGTGGPGFTFNLETTPLSLFTGDGQLSLAHTSDVNTNGSQFFVTFGNQQTALDGKFTLLGQLVRGFDVRDSIMNLNPSGDGKPSKDRNNFERHHRPRFHR